MICLMMQYMHCRRLEFSAGVGHILPKPFQDGNFTMLAVALTTGWNAMGNRLKDLRRGRNLTQQQLAEISGIGQSIIAKIEVGKVRLAEHHISKLAPALNCDPAELISESAQTPEREAELVRVLSDLTDEQVEALLRLVRAL